MRIYREAQADILVPPFIPDKGAWPRLPLVPYITWPGTNQKGHRRGGGKLISVFAGSEHEVRQSRGPGEISRRIWKKEAARIRT